jgi:ferritin
MRLLDFLLARDGTVKLKAIAEPKVKYESLASVFEEGLKQELETTHEIDKLYELAQKEKAFSALVQLQWFISEQVEEEKTAREIVAKFHHAKNDPAAIMDLDRELGSRAPDRASDGAA